MLLNTCEKASGLALSGNLFILHQINFSHWIFDKIMEKEDKECTVSFFLVIIILTGIYRKQKDEEDALGFQKWGQLSM